MTSHIDKIDVIISNHIKPLAYINKNLPLEVIEKAVEEALIYMMDKYKVDPSQAHFAYSYKGRSGISIP